ncbi:MAG TPA: c-type cytochrome [Thermoanaerobaculia bacterium]|jgi:cytochrome c2
MFRALTVILAMTPLLLACNQKEEKVPVQQPFSTTAGASGTAAGGGNPQKGLALIGQYGCNVCHIIPGSDGPQGALGPTLAKIGSQGTIVGGTVRITPDILAQYIQEPGSIYPQSTMPPLGMPDSEAQDIAAYLLTLK